MGEGSNGAIDFRLFPGKEFLQFFLPVGEDLLQLGDDQQRCEKIPQGAARHFVVNNVFHQGVFPILLQPVLMMPKPIGTEPLFIDEEIRGLQMGYLGDPIQGDTHQRFYGVGNDLSGIGLGGKMVGMDIKPHGGRRDGFQIPGVG